MKEKTPTYWYLMAFFAVGVGLYPIIYLLVDMFQFGLPALKSASVSGSFVWKYSFFTHISLGAVALISGVPQFNAKFRNKNINRHRILGKVYMLAVIISGLTGFYIAFYASAGIMPKVAFSLSAIAWLSTIYMAYTTIIKGKVVKHQQWMIRNYAITFSAVTLRIMLPTSGLLGIEFNDAYPVIAWLSWVPNLIFAEWLIKKMWPTVQQSKVTVQ